MCEMYACLVVPVATEINKLQSNTLKTMNMEIPAMFYSQAQIQFPIIIIIFFTLF